MRYYAADYGAALRDYVFLLSPPMAFRVMLLFHYIRYADAGCHDDFHAMLR